MRKFVFKDHCFAGLLLLAGFGVTLAEEQNLKMCNKQNVGNAMLLKEIMFSDLRGIGRTFYVDVAKDAKYFMSTVMNGIDGKEYDITIDGKTFVEGKVKTKNGWQALMVAEKSNILVSKAIFLSKGNHSISFSGKGPEIPQIEKISIAEAESNAQLSASDLLSWTKVMSSKVMPSNYLEQKKSDTLSSSQLSVAAASDPLYKYAAQLETSFSYSTFTSIYLTAGSVVTFGTYGSTVDPVMYVFNYSNPASFSLCNDDFGGSYESQISFTVPTTASYAIVLRSYYAGSSGTTTIKYNGTPLLTGTAIGGTMVYMPTVNSTGELNYFTAKPNTDPYSIDTDTRLFIMPNWTGAISGYNDDYYGSGNFTWGRFSRIKSSSSVSYCLVMHYYSGMSGVCDVYGKCGNGTEIIGSYFPNLKADDAIKSSDQNGYYNCINWSGGIVSATSSVWVNPFSTVEDFDNYYLNNYPGLTPRYAGAENFTRTGATTGNTAVNVWASGKTPPYTYTFTHGSVKKPANSQLHGYDWESKCGDNIRVFHPENALNGPGYGNVVYRYKPTGTYAQTQKMVAMGINQPIKTMDESVKLGLTTINKVVFSDGEKSQLARNINKIPGDISNEYRVKFDNWRKTWDLAPTKFMSNTRDYAKSDEYNAFQNFCLKQGKQIWPLLFDSFQNGNLFLINIFEDLMYTDRKNLMDDVKMKNETTRYSADGTYIVYSLDGNWREFCKKVLELEFE